MPLLERVGQVTENIMKHWFIGWIQEVKPPVFTSLNPSIFEGVS